MNKLSNLFLGLSDKATFISICSVHINSRYEAKYVFVHSDTELLDACRLSSPNFNLSMISDDVRIKLRELDMCSEVRIIYVS